jgi:hypothetical protein
VWHGISQPRNNMIRRITHKELTLLIGVVVALIVIFTLWVRQPISNLAPRSKSTVLSGIRNVKIAAFRSYVIAFEEHLSGRNNPY